MKKIVIIFVVILIPYIVVANEGNEIKMSDFVYQMKSNELKATEGSPPFNGLKNGDSAFLIIDSETQPGSINMGVLFSNESISVIVRNQQ